LLANWTSSKVPGDKEGKLENQDTVNRPTSRRTVVKLGVAVAGGIVLGNTYVKPNLLSVSVHETAHASAQGPLGKPVPGKPSGPPGPGLTHRPVTRQLITNSISDATANDTPAGKSPRSPAH
jgi:hypothetical protein